ncbi:Diacylglycerol kinase (ATP) protein [Dioscorea alata]|uniref:Diacylglycerol kinase (ATP) protein n=1 Tax=Dioscorea alata TaxID=55571 RepID=A0ACB7UBV9_DIOAL|nr:Diacylglycerol kinase (ATP) protein [Dioscorea alata]
MQPSQAWLFQRAHLLRDRSFFFTRDNYNHLTEGCHSPESDRKMAASSSTSEPSIWSSFRNSWLRIGKQELRRMVEIPSRIATAMTVAAMTKDADGPAYVVEPEKEERNLSEAPVVVVVFVNSRNGGRHGLMLKDRLQMLIGKDQVYI